MAQWYVTLAGIELGPLADGQLRQLALSGRLRPDDLVRSVGMARSVKADRLRGLFGSPSKGHHVAHPRTPATFSAWYERHPGRWPACLQLLAWFLYGFLWIPGWWALDLLGAQDENVQRLGRRVLETVGCLTIIVVTAVSMRQKQDERIDPSIGRNDPRVTATSPAAP